MEEKVWEYEEAIAYLKNLTKFGINLGLERIKALLAAIGNPEQSLRVIHIGGTNGKGSTCAFLSSVLQQAGYRMGMFISPHLHDYRERISINGELISRADVAAGIKLLKPALEKIVAEGVEHPTEFEVTTTLALNYFAAEQPDFVLLEVGLGGEIDSTNVVTPIVSVITSIAFDHKDYLGNTLAEIAAVKAGIIKEGIPVVADVDDSEAFEVIRRRAEAKAAKLIRLGQDVHYRKVASNMMDYQGLNLKFEGLEVALFGEHQLSNASKALAVCEILRDGYAVNIPEKAIREGLKKVSWPGRQELISTEPKILLDGAHNVQGMQSLAKALTDNATGYYQRDRLILCLGMLADKERAQALAVIAPLASQIIITKPDSARAGDWQELSALAEAFVGRENLLVIEDPILAVKEALKGLQKEDMLVITGSFYMLGPVREYLLNSWLSSK